MKLIDDHGRQIRKLRLSLTDKCNLRCHYCMPVDQTFMTESKYLKVNEISEIIKDLVDGSQYIAPLECELFKEQPPPPSYESVA